MIIALVGMPGCGKSTVGRHVARALHWAFVDSDAEVERALGCSIRSYFEAEGEAAFRDVEQATLLQLTKCDHTVLATGGGVVLREANRAALKAHGNKVVYLRAGFDDLLRRLRHDTHRPLLQGVDPGHRLRELFAQREPLYRELADFVIDTGRSSVNMISGLVTMQLEMSLPALRPGAGPVVAP